MRWNLKNMENTKLFKLTTMIQTDNSIWVAMNIIWPFSGGRANLKWFSWCRLGAGPPPPFRMSFHPCGRPRQCLLCPVNKNQGGPMGRWHRLVLLVYNLYYQPKEHALLN
jgi:hypothetical protein